MERRKVPFHVLRPNEEFRVGWNLTPNGDLHLVGTTRVFLTPPAPAPVQAPIQAPVQAPAPAPAPAPMRPSPLEQLRARSLRQSINATFRESLKSRVQSVESSTQEESPVKRNETKIDL